MVWKEVAAATSASKLELGGGERERNSSHGVHTERADSVGLMKKCQWRSLGTEED